MLISVIVFLLVYVAITFELVNKAVAAFSGVSILVLLNIISPHIPNLSEKHSSSHSDIPYAIMLIDYETIMLLFGMMIIVSVLKQSGLFTVIAIRIAELTKGKPIKILVLFSFVTAIMSAFLDNVTTVLIIIPLVIELTKGLGLDPKKYILSFSQKYKSENLYELIDIIYNTKKNMLENIYFPLLNSSLYLEFQKTLYSDEIKKFNFSNYKNY